MSEITGFIACDLGTTNSSVARYNGRAPEVIPVDGEPLMPSVVTILPADKVPEGTPDHERFVVGRDAVDEAIKDRSVREFMFRHIKRHRGEVWNDHEASGAMFIEGTDESGQPNGMTHYRGPDNTDYSPTLLEAGIVMKLHRVAEDKMKRSVNGVVMTVPANATPVQRKAVEESARMAGFEHIHTMDEPTAAALAYGFSRKSNKRNVIAVCDVGGGTTDASIIEVGGGFVGVLGTGSAMSTGGSDIDKRLRDHVLELWMKDQPGSDLSGDPSAMSLILDEAEAAKIRLSRKRSTEFRIDDIDKSADGVDLPMMYTITRDTLEEMVEDLIERMEEACKEAIRYAQEKDPKFTIADIHEVILVGGGTRMPAVQAMAGRAFGQEPKTDIDPEVAVVLGAAIQAAILEGQLTDVTVAHILPYSVRIETFDKVDGVATRLFDKGTAYPSKDVQKHMLHNREPGQTRMPVRIVVGDSDRATDCLLVHAFDFEIEPGDARQPHIELQIALNAKGEPFGVCGGEVFGSAQ